MAERPVFAEIEKAPFYVPVIVPFTWISGQAKVRQQMNITAIHQAFNRMYPDRKVLEISSKTLQEHGEDLSAFFLQKYVPSLGKSVSVECVYQSSKVFENGGPYTDLLNATSKQAKKDERLKTSGRLIGFRFEGKDYPVVPRSIFYNYIYMNALLENEALADELLKYDSFTDIAFNPNKGISCQAAAAAAYVGITKAGLKDQIRDFDSFMKLFSK